MNFAEITSDDLFDLGFEPVEGSSPMSIDYEHKETGLRIWKPIEMVTPQSKYWKHGYGRDKINFESLDALKEFMRENGADV